MRWKLGKCLELSLLVSCLWLMVTACDTEQLYDLHGPTAFTMMPEGVGESLSFEEMRQKENFQPPDRIEHLDAFQKAWIRYDIPLPALEGRPALLLGLCGNIDKVAWGDRILMDDQLKSNFSLEVIRSTQPYFLLPMDQGPKPLYFRVLWSHRTGFQPDCREVRVGPEATVVKRFTVFQAFETMTSVIMLFLAIMSFIIWFFKRERTILLFGFFSGSVGSTFFAVSHPVHFSLPGIPWLLHVWNFSVMLSPTAFMAFFYHILPARIRTLQVLAWANLLPWFAAMILFASGNEVLLEQLRVIFFQLLGPQLITIALLAMPLLIRSPYPAPILTVGLVVLFLGTALDIASLLLNWPFFEGTCISLIFFMGTLITYLIQVHIDRERSLEVDRTQSLEEYSLKLAKEVEQRSQVLQVKTDELEQSNFDLEEKNILLSISHKRLEDLIGQKDALLKKVAEISSDLLPNVLAALKTLYEQRNKIALQNLRAGLKSQAARLSYQAMQHKTDHSYINEGFT